MDKMMEKRKCPACGAENPHSMVRCGKYRAYICEKHCGEGCEYFSGHKTSITHCFFREKKIEEKKKLLELQEKHFQEENK